MRRGREELRSIWPTNSTIGVESWRAICTPGEALVAPGPRVTKHTPGRPVALPIASAIIAAPASLRQTVIVDVTVAQRVEHRKIAFAGDAENVAHPVDDQLIDERLGGAARAGGLLNHSGSGLR